MGQTVLGPVTGKLGGAFMGLLGTFGPVIAGIGSIIAVVSLLGDHFADIQQIVLKVFGPTGLTIFNTFFADVKKIGDGIKNAFSLDNLLNIQEKLSGKSMFGVDLGQAFGAAIPIIQSVTGLVSQIVDLGVNHIKPLLADVMSFVVNELFPAVAPLIGTIIDLVGTTLVNAIKVIVDVMEAIKMVISAMPAWMAVVCLFGGVFIGALALVRLGYSVVVAKAAYKWICWAEENVIGSKMGEEKKKQVIKALRDLTPDWLDWAINEKFLDFFVELIFKVTKSKLEAYMEKKSKETATVARFGKAGEDNDKKLGD